jgi:hypothetical protein
MTKKPFAWSYSRLKNFETCPKRHWHLDLQKDVKGDDSEQLRWGNQVHKAAAKRLTLGTPLPMGMDTLGEWCDRLLAVDTPKQVELKLAITRDFAPCDYFAKDVWFRGVADVLMVDGNAGIALDWKTGKILEDGVQLALMAACIFGHNPDVQKVRTEFVWLKEGGVTTREDFDRDTMAVMWRHIWPRIEMLENAYKTTSYPAKPGYLCRKWCPVKQCPHHGE